MKLGETASVCVRADTRWNDSGIDLVPGCDYSFIVPNGETWTDWTEACGPDGYKSTPLLRFWEEFRRVREADWFTLIGTIGRSARPPIIIGSKLLNFPPPYPGRLYLFANDVWCMYWNNKGQIDLKVTRIN